MRGKLKTATLPSSLSDETTSAVASLVELVSWVSCPVGISYRKSSTLASLFVPRGLRRVANAIRILVRASVPDIRDVRAITTNFHVAGADYAKSIRYLRKCL